MRRNQDKQPNINNQSFKKDEKAISNERHHGAGSGCTSPED
jgi:hypothetical protein